MNNPAIKSSKPRTRTKRGSDEEPPTVLHYVPHAYMQDKRRYYTLCGESASIDMPTTERASNGGTNYVICPMCALAKQEREEGYPDSPEPLSTLALREAVFVILAHLNITVQEVADRMHTDPDRLYRGITTAKIGLGELAEFCEAIGISVPGLCKFTNTIQTDIIERRNNHKETTA